MPVRIRGAVLGLALAGLVLARLPSVANAADTSLFLPYVSQTPPPEPCGPASSDPCATGAPWTLVCGGFGRLRDLGVPTVATAPDATHILAVGDGATVLDVAAPGSDPTVPPAFAWRPQVGLDLTAINALGLNVADGAVLGWAVGDRDHIFDLHNGCWRSDEFYDNAKVNLLAIHGMAEGKPTDGGWIVGRQTAVGSDGEPTEVAALRIMNVAGPLPTWRTYVGAPNLPPLSDVSYLGETHEAWAVGTTADDQGVFALGIQGLDGFWRWTVPFEQPGAPRELSMTRNGTKGWAFGSAAHSGLVGFAAWHYVQGGPVPLNWAEELSLFRPNRSLVDAYTADDNTMWVGVSPNGIDPVLMRYGYDVDHWASTGGVPPAGLPPDAGEGSRAIAPLGDGRVLYAWGDELWLYQAPSLWPGDTEHWVRLRKSRSLTGLAVIGDTVWSLADDGPGSVLMGLIDGTFQVVAGSDGRLNALDAAGDTGWAVGNGGVALRAQGGHWKSVHSEPPVDGDLLAVSVTPDGTAWSAGVGTDGHGRVWRFEPGGVGWELVMRTRAQVTLGAIAALPDGHVWAVGQRCTVVRRDPNGTVHEGPDCPPSASPDLTAVAVTVPGDVWVAGQYYLGHGYGAALDWSLVPSMGPRDTVTALAAAAPGDVWLTYGAIAPANRAASTVLHRVDGTWRRETVLNVPIHTAQVVGMGAERTVWLAGEGSTVARFSYPLAGQ